MDRHLIILRHGNYESGDSPLSARGIEQMKKLKAAIELFALQKAKEAKDDRLKAIFVSFSFQKRAVESVLLLRWVGHDVVMTNENETERFDIRDRDGILRKVIGIADYYDAGVIVIVAHGAMPSVITETAHEFVTHERLGLLPDVPEGCGFITNLVTGEVTHISHDQPIK